MKLLYIFLGGGLGSVLRYLVSGYAQRMFEATFPYGTMAVNLIGSLAIGLAWGAFERENIGSGMRSFLFIGLFGGFTTFSTFANESFGLLRDGNIKFFLLNIGISNVIGVLLVYLGYVTARALLTLYK